jgi:HSP20 family protein
MIGATRIERDPWGLFDELMFLQDDFNRLFEGTGGVRRGGAYPPVNVWLGDDDVIVDAELPGVDAKDVEISVLNDHLTLRGKAQTEETPNTNMTLHRRERPHGDFSRTIVLPYRVESGKVTAVYRNGILRITMPRAEAEKPQRVAIEAA